MPPYDLTRVDAANRSATVVTRSAHVDLDLTQAPDPSVSTFPVRVRWEFDLAPGKRTEAGTDSKDGDDGAPAPEDSGTETPPHREDPMSTFLDFIGVVDTVVINGHHLSTKELERAVSPGRIELTGLRERNTVTVEGHGYYSRSGEGMHRYTDPQDGAVYLYTQYEPTDARRVMPCFDQPDLRTEWTFTISAPETWAVSSNARMAQTEGARRTFHPTASLPSYLTSVLAGPYHRVDDQWAASNPEREQSVPLTLWCRASMAEHLPAQELFDLTRAGLDFFTDLFDLDFPFDSYEQAFVPEYNLGAMENPGLVTFTEDYLFPDGPTAQQRAARANTVLHEMAHMYFGDLVTIRWWEDLWLKESFAEFMGAYASAEATEFTSAWAGFAVRRKAWAYRQDALSTTHPIVARVPDVAAAKQNFDGITYAKGAAALKQLVAFVGIEEFIAACRLYFRRHAWGSAELADFLAALAETSSRDTNAWARDWLTTTGATDIELTLDREAGTHDAGTHDDSASDAGDTDVVEADNPGPEAPITRAALIPRGTVHDSASTRAHRLAIGLYSPGEPWSRTRRITVDLPADHPVGEAFEVPELIGATGLVLINDDDLDYAQYRPDPGTTAQLLNHLAALPTYTARAVGWSHLWLLVREALLDPADYLRAVTDHVGTETESVVFETVLERCLEAVEHYLPRRRRAEHRGHLTRFVVEQLRAAEPGSDSQNALARIFAHLVARDSTYAGWAIDLLTGRETLPGLTLGPSLRWRLMTGLVASNHTVESWILKESERDSSRPSQIGRARTLAARPTRWAKDAAWQEVLGTELSNDLLTATIEGFQLGNERLLAAYREQYFAMLNEQWGQRSIGMATRVVGGLYPRHCDPAPGTRIEDDDVVRRTRQWLRENPDSPAALRRVVMEQLDERRRRLRIQAGARP